MIDYTMRIESLKTELMLDQIKISTALTQTKIYSQKLGVDCEWIKQELEGYNYKTIENAKKKLPKYRLLYGKFIDESNIPIIFDKLLLDIILPWPIVYEIVRINPTVEEDNVMEIDATDWLNIFKKSDMFKHMVLPMTARFIVTKSDVQSFLEAVKNRLIEFLETLIDKSKIISLR